MTQENPWHGRTDTGEQGDTRRLHQIVRLDDGYGAGDAVLAGFASDAGVARNHGRIGARHGPQVARRALASLPAHALAAFWDAGDVVCEGDALEAAQAAQAARITALLGRGARPVVLGGGHEIAWADYQGLRDHLYANGRTAGRLLVLNFDAHFDLRSSRPGHSGTPFDQILHDAGKRDLPLRYACLGVSRLGNTPALYERARTARVHYAEDSEMQERHLEARLADIDHLLAEAEHVYLTIDTDVLPASIAPGVSAPAPYGVPLPVVEACLLHVKASGKLVLADIAEFNPEHDIDGHTARAVARLAWKLLQP